MKAFRAAVTGFVGAEAAGAAALMGLLLPGHAALAAAVLAAGLGAAALLWWGSGRMKRAWLLPAIVLAAATAAPASAIWPGGVTHARFGLTVVGACPIPALDVTIDGDGRLGFREKSHLIRKDELAGLIDDRTEFIIVGTGWDGVADVEPAARELRGVETLRSGEAVARYRELKRAGRRVVLILHTTC